ncbi:hypothetical protein ACWEF9_11590 [Streptomyces sp. NPDC004980]
MLDAPTERFVAAVGELPPDVLAEVFEHSLLLYPGGGREAALALKLSASAFSELNRAVASALLPRAGELDAFREGCTPTPRPRATSRRGPSVPARRSRRSTTAC